MEEELEQLLKNKFSEEQLEFMGQGLTELAGLLMAKYTIAQLAEGESDNFKSLIAEGKNKEAIDFAKEKGVDTSAISSNVMNEIAEGFSEKLKEII